MSSGLIGSKVTSWTSRTPSAQMRGLDRLGALLLGRPGAEVRETDQHRQEDGGECGQQAAADHLATSQLGLVDHLVHLADDPGHVLGLGGRAVPVVDHLPVVHQLPGPLHRSDADEQQRESEGQAEAEVAGVGAEGTEVEVPRPGHGEVDDHEPDGQHRNQPEEGGHLPGRPLGGLLVDVGQPRQVLLVARIGHRVAGVVPGRQVGALVLGRDRNLVLSGHFAFAPLAAIQTAKNIKVPRPRIQAHSPSLTGPRPPSASPPSLGRSCSSFR